MTIKIICDVCGCSNLDASVPILTSLDATIVFNSTKTLYHDVTKFDIGDVCAPCAQKLRIMVKDFVIRLIDDSVKKTSRSAEDIELDRIIVLHTESIDGL